MTFGIIKVNYKSSLGTISGIASNYSPNTSNAQVKRKIKRKHQHQQNNVAVLHILMKHLSAKRKFKENFSEY